MADRAERPKGTFDMKELADTTIVLANQKTTDRLEDISYVGYGYTMDKEVCPPGHSSVRGLITIGVSQDLLSLVGRSVE